MFHFSFPSHKQALKQKRLQRTLVIISVVCLQLSSASLAFCEPLNVIQSLLSKSAAHGSEIRISAKTSPTYTAYELFNPQRIVVDIAESELGSNFDPALSPEMDITVNAKQLTDIDPPMVRLEFTLPGSGEFSDSVDGNDIVLSLTSNKQQNEASGRALINDVKVQTQPGKTVVRIEASAGLVDYTYDVLDGSGTKPSRMFLDINNVSGDTLLKEHQVGTSLEKIRIAKRGSGLRFVFDSATPSLFPFSIQPVDHGLEVIIDEVKNTDEIANIIGKKSDIEGKLPAVKPLEVSRSASQEKQLEEAFNFSGYTKERITVDFYKIDLHNVFRLLREVSGINIVVAEGVSGSLTLALDDVPWDFALDIILNLKGLAKEERFNTLVIYPKDGKFAWPQQADNSVTFEPDMEVTEQEALIIQQQKSMPKEVIEAKQLMGKAKKAEGQENYELAIRLYEQAFSLWKDNSKLANKIGAIYLVRLRQNAKAVYYAKKALDIDPTNTSAALNAAIASANMQENEKALEYFDQSISAENPSSEALLSYAVFSEGQKEYDGALKLLDKHDALYGRNLGSMIAAARIYDKMGNEDNATEEYKAILLAGFRVPPDLKKYITSRLALKQSL